MANEDIRQNCFMAEIDPRHCEIMALGKIYVPETQNFNFNKNDGKRLENDGD
jgi:hypothetical protein